MRRGVHFGQSLPRSVAVPGHLGELLQGRIGPSGPVALLTLPCPALCVHGFWRPGAFELFQPGRPVLSPAQVRQILARLGLPVRGQFTLRAEMPLGGGAGSSTAALIAVALLAGHPPEAVARLASATVAFEGASDPLMLPQPGQVLWASRQGRVLLPLPPLPPFEVLGGFFGPNRPTDPLDSHFPDISDLVAELPRAFQSGAALAAIASESARRTLALRSEAGAKDPIADLAADLGALGHAIGHTGPARALLFAPGTVPPRAREALIETGFRQIVQFRPVP